MVSHVINKCAVSYSDVPLILLCSPVDILNAVLLNTLSLYSLPLNSLLLNALLSSACNNSSLSSQSNVQLRMISLFPRY